MANEPTIRTFSAADIERYHKGQLAPGEMHALEKAALDDPFLADALEGYALPDTNVAADLDLLQQRLTNRVKEKEKKVIPMAAAGRQVPWLRIAAMILLVAGTGYLVFRIGFTDRRSEIAQAPKTKVQQVQPDIAPADKNTNPVAVTGADSAVASPKAKANNNSTVIHLQQEAMNNYIPADTISSLFTQTPAPAAADGRKDHYDYEKKELSNAPAKSELSKENKQVWRDTASLGLAQNNNTQRTFNTDRQNQAQNNYRFATPAQRTNVFRGKVTDGHNNALPFANITNVADNVGTYTDARGNFVLTSPDSVLNVQVRSIGFENNTVQLNNSVASNQVTLQDDRSLGEVVISNRQQNSVSRSRSNNNNMVLEEPEPIDGWVNYDTYLANNLVVPETFRSRQNSRGEVELSFEVNRNGQPVNITVDRSLCDSCDKEAIRLIQQGPKWKRKARKGRTTVTISF